MNTLADFAVPLLTLALFLGIVLVVRVWRRRPRALFRCGDIIRVPMEGDDAHTTDTFRGVGRVTRVSRRKGTITVEWTP